MRKGIFIPDITVEMFRNASLEAVEELLVSGTMEDIEIPDRPNGEWIETYYSIDGVGASRFKCSKCEHEISTYGKPYNFCPNCGYPMKKGGE